MFYVSFDTGAFCLLHFTVDEVTGTFLGMTEDEPLDPLVSGLDLLYVRFAHHCGRRGWWI